MSDAIKEIHKIRDKLDAYEENMKQQADMIFDQIEKNRTIWRKRMQNKVEEAPSDELSEPGKIRVGRITHTREKGKKQYAVTEGYTNIIVTSHNTKKLGHTLSPYVLKDHKGRLMENLWQFAKIYAQVGEQNQKTWSHEAEAHALNYKKGKPLDVTKITPEYWKWRSKGMNHKFPVRYPNGYAGKAKCIGCLWPRSGNSTSNILDTLHDVENEYIEMDQLDYISARKRVYVPLYIALAKQTEEFAELQAMLQRGENLQIMDVDGPDDTIYDDKLPFPYNTMTKGTHGVTSGVGSIEMTEENVKALLNDPTQPFGHGYCLAVALLGKEEWFN